MQTFALKSSAETENVLKTDLSVTLNYDVMMVMMNSIAVSLFFQNIMIIMRIHIESIKSDQNNFFPKFVTNFVFLFIFV